MISLKIAVDESDASLGSYFESCKQDLIDFIRDEALDVDIDEISSKLCNPVYVEERISQINSNRYLFVVYSHGEATSLLVNGYPYVERDNCKHFKNSFVYSTACHVGKHLGGSLIENGSEAFIGYNEIVQVLAIHLREASVRCDNSGIKFFISGNSIGRSFDLMKAFYSTEINRLIRSNDPVNASHLRTNQSRLVFLGNPDLTINDFINCI